jgi:hypothetical protein
MTVDPGNYDCAFPSLAIYLYLRPCHQSVPLPVETAIWLHLISEYNLFHDHLQPVYLQFLEPRAQGSLTEYFPVIIECNNHHFQPTLIPKIVTKDHRKHSRLQHFLSKAERRMDLGFRGLG